MSHSKQGITDRLCLRCTKKFKSTGIGNRICKDCKTSNAIVPHIKEINLSGSGRADDYVHELRYAKGKEHGEQ